MKKLFLICFLCLLACNTVNAATVKQVVALNTSVNEAAQILKDTVNLYATKFQLIFSDPERNIYTVKYNYGLYRAKSTSNVNIQINPDETHSNYGTVADEGGFSCSFKDLNGKDTLITCRKISMTADYIYNHFEKYLKELKLNGVECIPYKKYKKLNSSL